jgi:hypothetical protein
VDIGPNGHSDDRDTESFAYLESGKSLRVKKVAENEIGREAANVRPQDTGSHPSVERPGNQRQRWVIVVANFYITP